MRRATCCQRAIQSRNEGSRWGGAGFVGADWVIGDFWRSSKNLGISRCFERVRLQSCRKRCEMNQALAPEGIYATQDKFVQGCLRIKQRSGRTQHVLGLDGQQARLRSLIASVVAAALGASQNFELRPERPVAGWIGGAVDAHNRASESAGQVERAGVAGNGQGHAASESDQLGERAGERSGRASGLAGND